MPTTMSFYARGDGSSANNAALNVDSKAQQPTVQITFEASPGGDIVLERNGGAPDPDTTVLINGIRYNFTVELTGGLPASNGKVPIPLEGKEITVISTVINGRTERFFFVNDGTGSISMMNQIGNGAIPLTNANFAPDPVHVCFCAGTVILTPSGYCKIEDLALGDSVVTARGEVKPILWIGRTDVSVEEMQNDPSRRPVRIKANAISPAVPFADIYLSAQHRIVIEDPMAALLFSDYRVMVRATHLVGSTAEAVMPQSPVSYFHMLLDEHDMVIANGLETESFQPSLRNHLGLPSSMKNSFIAHVPQDHLHRLFQRPDAMSTLRAHEVDVLIACMFAKRSRSAPKIPQFQQELKAAA